MAKKILVIDTDGWTDCRKCPLHFEFANLIDCIPTERTIYETGRIPDWCPLKDLPLRMGTDDNGIMGAFVAGYNTCLNMIEGKEGE